MPATILALIKLIHVLAAIVAVGSNLTYALWLRAAGRDRDRLVFAIETIRRIDTRVANPAYAILLLTGLAMVAFGPFSLEQGWIAAALILYVLVAIVGIVAFAPAVRRQLEAARSDPTSKDYVAAERRSTVLGLLTTAIVLVIVGLMVLKPF